MSDGNLRALFQKHLPDVHWQSIETLIGRGTPDMNGCFDGQEFWIENKSTSGWKVIFETGQVAWHERRARAGGRTFVAVRRQASAGPRRGAATDELWLFDGKQSREISSFGLKDASVPFLRLPGGPAKWDWQAVRRVLIHH